MDKQSKTLIIAVAVAFAMTACNAAQPLASILVNNAGTSSQTAQQSITDATVISEESVIQADDQLVSVEQTSPASAVTADTAPTYSYTIVDTSQAYCYDDRAGISCPTAGEDFFGQDAQYSGLQARYVDNGDGTVTDLNTGLMWIQDPGDKMLYFDAIAYADSFLFAGYDDWRVPTIKELYSLMDFSGVDDAVTGTDPFIDTDYFIFEYGDPSIGERELDSQWVTSTIYEASVMDNQECFFGVNFADGRIKCYPTSSRMGKTYFLRMVRGGEGYGENELVDNGDGTVSDLATGLVWQGADSTEGMDWSSTLNYCESLDLAGQDDWRLPNAKELQSIVDYTRSPDTTGSAAIDPIFSVSEIVNEAGQQDYPFYWTSTSHVGAHGAQSAVYIAFGRALGYFNNVWMDVHGAGAQRSDPKSGDPADYPSYFGPQGDASRLLNYVRCVRGGVSDQVITGGEVDQTAFTQPAGDQGLDQRPSGQNVGGQPSPPQEAIDACSGLSAGAACTVGPGGGTCENIQSQLACVPANRP